MYNFPFSPNYLHPISTGDLSGRSLWLSHVHEKFYKLTAQLMCHSGLKTRQGQTCKAPGFCIFTVSIPADARINASTGPICELSQPFEGTMH